MSGNGLDPRWPDRIVLAARRLRRGGRRIRTMRRLLALMLLVAAGLAAARQQAPEPPGTSVVVVSRDLPLGAVLRTADLSLVVLPRPPDGALTDPSQISGRILAAPIRRGETLTDARLVPPAGADPGPGRVAVPVRIADASVAALLTPGAHVAVLRTGPGTPDGTTGAAGTVTRLTSDAVVLSVPAPGDEQRGRVVLLAVPTSQADDVAAAGSSGALAVRFTS